MAKDTTPQAAVDAATLGNAIADAIRGLQPPRALTFDEFKPVTPFNPRGVKHRELPFPCFQNGSRMNADVLHDEEISLLGQLKPGRFCNGLVLVQERDRNGQKEIHLHYANGTPDQRMALKGEARNLTELLRRCVDEANHGA